MCIRFSLFCVFSRVTLRRLYVFSIRTVTAIRARHSNICNELLYSAACAKLRSSRSASNNVKKIIGKLRLKN